MPCQFLIAHPDLRSRFGKNRKLIRKVFRCKCFPYIAVCKNRITTIRLGNRLQQQPASYKSFGIRLRPSRPNRRKIGTDATVYHIPTGIRRLHAVFYPEIVKICITTYFFRSIVEQGETITHEMRQGIFHLQRAT